MLLKKLNNLQELLDFKEKTLFGKHLFSLDERRTLNEHISKGLNGCGYHIGDDIEHIINRRGGTIKPKGRTL